MLLSPKFLASAAVVAFCFAGCNQADSKQANEPASSTVSTTKNGEDRESKIEDRESRIEPHAGITHNENDAANPRSSILNPRSSIVTSVTLLRVPNGGIQPQALVDAKGALHLIYFKGTRRMPETCFMCAGCT